MNNIAIVVVTYNRLDSLKRLLFSLEQANYSNESPTLIISIDKGPSDIVERFADNYHWKHGEKIVRKHDVNLGLRNHMMSLGEWFDYYETIIVLEDDIVVSPCFYAYARQAADKYMGSEDICGISLYGFTRNYQTRMPFIPKSSEYDGYFMNCAMSWGEVWMKPQWIEFYDWYLNNQEFEYQPNLPALICRWRKSWLKYHTRYCIETNKYFLFPYVSLSTNSGDVGVHVGKGKKWGFQVPLQHGNKTQYRLPDNPRDAVCYDGFFENKSIYEVLGLDEKECCIDLNGTQCNIQKKRYWLTLQKSEFPIVKSFALSQRPIEMSVINSEPGNEIFLYDTGYSDDKHAQSKLLPLFLYNIEEISSFVKQYGMWNFIVDSLKLIFKR